jgi:multisubunit Na+/H+ antiporter MnhG subunit
MRINKRIITLLSGIVGIAFLASLFFVKNTLLSLSLLAILPLLLCPVACGVIGGLIWLTGRPLKSKKVDNKKHEECC